MCSSFFFTRSELLKLVEEGVVCPMCVETIAASDVKSLSPSQITRGGAEREASTPEEEVISYIIVMKILEMSC
jgi:hypothetical protein